MNEADFQQLTARLKERREELLTVTGMGKDARKPVELDQTAVGRLSRMDAMQNQAMAQATERRRQVELMRIAQALERIEKDEYGDCLVCGNEIAVKRLEIDPTAVTCVPCAGQNT
jgi:RNA polymerase-binding transcription factor